MNRSYSKIRHIQESNQRIEKRFSNSKTRNFNSLINEQDDDVIDDSKFHEIMKLDNELENDELYKEYERKYLKHRIIDTLKDSMGIDPDAMSEEELGAMIEMFSGIMDMGKSSGMVKKTPQTIRMVKDGTIKMIETLIDMASEDGETELVSKLEKFNEALRNF